MELWSSPGDEATKKGAVQQVCRRPSISASKVANAEYLMKTRIEAPKVNAAYLPQRRVCRVGEMWIGIGWTPLNRYGSAFANLAFWLTCDRSNQSVSNSPSRYRLGILDSVKISLYHYHYLGHSCFFLANIELHQKNVLLPIKGISDSPDEVLSLYFPCTKWASPKECGFPNGRH